MTVSRRLRRQSARTTSGAALALAAASTAPAISMFIVILVALVSYAGAAGPLLLQEARTGTVRAAIDDVAPAERDLTASTRGIATPGPASGSAESVPSGAASAPPEAAFDLPSELAPVWGAPLEQLAQTRAALPEDLRGVLDPPRLVVALDNIAAVPPAGAARPANRVMLTFDPDSPRRTRFVEGVAPDTTAPSITPDETASGVVDAFSIGLSRVAAADLAWPVGESRTMGYPRGIAFKVTLSGIFEAADPDDREWDHVPTGLNPDVVYDGSGSATYYATAYASPGRLSDALVVPDSAASVAWLPLAVDREQGATAASVAAQLRGFASTQVPFAVVVERQQPTGLAFRSSSANAIDAGIGRADAMTAVVSLVAVGPVAVAIVALALTGRMLSTRRVGSVRLARARGGSMPRLAVLLAIEGLILGGIGATIGCLAAAVAPGWGGAASVVIPLLVALTPAVVVPVLTVHAAAQTARSDLGVPATADARRRLVAEASVLVGAAVVVWLVATRATSDGVDPVLTMLPLALAAAGCVFALRLVPLVLSVIERGAPSRSGLVGLLGPARARRDPAVRAAPVLAVVVGIAIALFAVAFSETVRTGIHTSAQAQVGADVRLTAPYLPQDQLERLAGLDGVEATAPVYFDQRVDGEVGGQRVPLVVYVMDVEQLAAVQAGLPTAIALPATLRDRAGDAVPVVASRALASRIGSSTLEIDGTVVDVVSEAPTVSPFGGAESWVLVDRANAERLVRDRFAPSVVLVDVATSASAEEIAEAARAVAGPEASTTTPTDVRDRLRDDPALIAVETGLVASVIAVALLLGFAVGMTLVLGAAARGRMLALLGALGYPRRRELPLVAWEVGPALLLALPVGVGVGLAMPYLVLPSLDLSRFIGAAEQPAVHIGGWLSPVVIGAFLIVAVVAVALATAAASRVSAATTLRSIDEEGSP
ncbi:hypothetical protein ACFM35_12650 [Microbacterium sp. P01]|uniref:hypothetical protein n=1 Tax=Microbacterium sp. P01 TaxID=3366261 RepID=UPI0036717447